MATAETDETEAAPTGPTPSGGPSRLRWLTRGVLVLAGVVVLVLVVQSVVAYTALRDARRAQQQLVKDLDATDLAAARRHVEQLASATSRAQHAVWGPWWALPEAVPWYGDDVRAVRLTVRELDTVSRKVAVPLVDTTATIQDGLRRPDGTVDVGALGTLQHKLSAATGPADRAATSLARINAGGLAGPLRPAVEDVRDGVDRIARTVHAAQDGLVVARAVIGAQQPRTTLLGVQNPSEARGTGGLISAWAVLHGSGGAVSLAATGVNDELIHFPAQPSDVPADALTLYGDRMLDVRNINMGPDFPVAARLLADGYRRFAADSGAPALPDDALVLTVTPRALGRLLAVTGPVTVRGYDKPITAGNAASMFTNGVYRVFPDEVRRTFFVQEVLTQVFARLQQPGVEPAQLVHQLQRMVVDRDVMAWSDRPDVEAALDRLDMSGSLPRPDGSTARVSLLNTDASKLDYYLRASISLTGVGPRRALEVTLRNTAPAVVPAYVGNHDPRTDLPATTHDVVLQVHLPPDATVDQVLRDGSPTGVANGTESGWHVVRLSVRLPRGTSTTVRLDLRGAAGLTEVLAPVMTSPVPVTLR